MELFPHILHESSNILQLSFTVHDFLYFTYFLNVNKSTFHLKGWSRIFINRSNKNNVTTLLFNLVSFQIRDFLTFLTKFCGIDFLKFECHYERSLAKISYLTLFFKSKSNRKTFAQKKWKIHAKMTKRSAVRLWYVKSLQSQKSQTQTSI